MKVSNIGIKPKNSTRQTLEYQKDYSKYDSLFGNRQGKHSYDVAPIIFGKSITFATYISNDHILT